MQDLLKGNLFSIYACWHLRPKPVKFSLLGLPKKVNYDKLYPIRKVRDSSPLGQGISFHQWNGLSWWIYIIYS